ncbi:MAG: urease accessory protein UreE [Paracoccaceae bacterium]
MTETVTLDYQSRYFRRRMVQTDQGREVLIDAAEARSYADGEKLTAADGTRLAIRAAVEPLAEVRGRNLARLAWHIGNRHTPAEVRTESLLIQRDHVLEAMLRGLGAEVSHIEDSFPPDGGAYGHGRTHGHSHSHDPHADPNAHIPHRHDHTHSHE